MRKVAFALYALVVGVCAVVSATIGDWLAGPPWGWLAFVAVTVAGGVFADRILQLHRDALEQLEARQDERALRSSPPEERIDPE